MTEPTADIDSDVTPNVTHVHTSSPTDMTMSSSSLLALLERATNAGTWVLLLPQGDITLSPSLLALLEWPATPSGAEADAPRFASALTFYAEASRPRVEQAFNACLDGAEAREEDVELVTATGRTLPARLCVRASRDALGMVWCLQGVLHSVGANAPALASAGTSTVPPGRTPAHHTGPFALLDAQGQVVQANSDCEHLLQTPASALLGQPLWQVLRGPATPDSSSMSVLEESIHQVRKNASMAEFEEFYESLGKWLAVRITPAADGVAVDLRDVSGSRQSHEQLLLLQTSISKLNDMVVITEAGPLDAPGPRIVFVNDAFERRTGYTRAEVLGRNPRMLQGKRTERSELDRIRKALDAQQPVRAELTNYTKGGLPYWVELEIVPVDYFRRGLTHWVAVARDISGRKTAEDKIEGLAFYDALTELPNRQMLMSRLERLLLATEAGESPASAAPDPTTPAWLPTSSVLHAPSLADSDTDRNAFSDTMPQEITDDSESNDGEARVPHASAAARRASSANRRQPAVGPSATNVSALMFIDLDHFKILNDTLGHATGDLLLQKVALRLARCVRLSDTVARLGGDEFVVMLENLGLDGDEPGFTGHPTESAQYKARIVGEKIVAALRQPCDLGNYQHHSTCSVGITVFGARPITMSDVLKQADLAMYQAKAEGRNGICFFNPAMQALAISNAALNSDLRRGLREQEFELYYQPQVGRDNRMFGAEALLRWKHPTRGMVMPDDFIGLAEESGLIMPLGQWVLQTACEQLAKWAGRPETERYSIAVNVSMRQFRHPEFVDQVLGVIAQTGIRAHCLKLELTESLLATGLEVTIAKMGQLKKAGVTLSIDDFGIGYSALSYLKYLPLDQLKIDRAFVKDVLSDPNDAAIARTIIGLAQSLGLDVVAEGVETEEQRVFLAKHGCDNYQGWLFCKALPIDQLEAFMQVIRHAELLV